MATLKQFIRKGFTPRWGDLDVNQHVNNVKYTGWILESAPISILEKHELASITLDVKPSRGDRMKEIKGLWSFVLGQQNRRGVELCSEFLTRNAENPREQWLVLAGLQKLYAVGTM